MYTAQNEQLSGCHTLAAHVNGRCPFWGPLYLKSFYVSIIVQGKTQQIE